MFKAFDNIINYLFRNNEWKKFVSVIYLEKRESEDTFFQPKYFGLKELAPIIIGYGFFMAKYFDQVYSLAKVCYEERYLSLLNKNFLISKELWRFEKFGKIELSTKEKEIQYLFQRANTIGEPKFLQKRS